MEQLEGKVAVVTGGASGIGRALAQRFAAEGMILVLADVEEETLAVAAKELADDGATVFAVPTDVSQHDSVDALAAATLEEFGAVHVVCNNAGVGGHGAPSWDGPLADWEWVVGVNLWGVIYGTRAFLPALVEQDEGHVVNTASAAGLGAIPFMAPYSATKHAVVAMSEALFHELALNGSNVGVSVLCPGFLNTRIAEFGRNWPERLGPRPMLSDEPAAQFMQQFATTAVEAGPPPTELADSVVDAIRTGRFMLITDEKLATAATAARAAEVEGNDPQLPIG